MNEHGYVAPARQLCSGSNREIEDEGGPYSCPVCTKSIEDPSRYRVGGKPRVMLSAHLPKPGGDKRERRGFPRPTR